MSLDAVVYCDCYETGRLREPPPPGCRAVVTRDGSLDCVSDDGGLTGAFFDWLFERACEHENGVLIHHYLGSVGWVNCLQEVFVRSKVSLPMITSRVTYDGLHTGDYIAYSELSLLQADVETLARVHCRNANMEGGVRYFESQMRELVQTALRVKKPIAF